MMVPAPGQGCLAIQTRDDDGDTIEAVIPLDHEPSHRALDAERSLMWRLGGGCALPGRPRRSTPSRSGSSR